MKLIAAITVLVATLTCAQAAITWVGGTSGDMFEESNWDLSGSSVTTIDPNVSIDDDVFIGAGPFTNDPVIPQLDAQMRFQLADARVLTLDGGTIGIDGNDGVGGAPGTSNGPIVNVLGGGAFNPFFIVNGVNLNIDATSTATFGGGGNPINISTVDLKPGAVVTFLAETPDAFRGEHLAKFSVNGAAAVEGGNITVEASGGAGSTITAVPEPGSVALAGLSLLFLLGRRRR